MKLYLHVGHGKTGSSALQSWLALNASVLWSRHRILYPQISPFTGSEETQARQLKFSMGNGFILHEILQAPVPRENLRMLTDTLGADGTLLFSREAFLRELARNMDELCRLASEAGLGGPNLLLFLRDPLEHAHSLYGQMVKAHGLAETITDWLPRYNLLAAIEAFLEAVINNESAQLTVHNYSRASSALFQNLAQWLGGSDGLPGLQPPPLQPINRSLCSDEIRFMRLLNQRHGREAAGIGRRLVELPAPVGAAPYRVPVEVQQRFLEGIQPIVARINSRLPPEAALQLRLLPENCSCSEPEPAPDAPIPLPLLPQQIAMVLAGLGAPI